VGQVILLIAMAIAISSSAAGIAKPQGIKFSMYLRILVPIVFSRALRNCFCMTLRIGLTFMDIMVCNIQFMLKNLLAGQFAFHKMISNEGFRLTFTL
jgi:two pore calcium channel protein